MAAPRQIGRFALQGEVASGSSGTIYQARDEGTGERVAIKLIRGLGDVDAARFAREVRVLSGIQHPGVVRYVGHGHTFDGDAYLAMEWLEGEDLRERLARTGLSMNETVALGRRVASALAEVHKQGLVHRDIKPGNIYLPAKRAEDAKIIDFGLARADQAATAVTQTGLVVGTPAYMAPEQARGQREIDGRADVFSLGCVLFKCIGGRPPFEGSSVMAVLTKVLLENPPRLRDLRAEVPPALDDLVASMLHKEARARPPSAAAVAEALGALGPLGPAGESTEPAPPSRAFSGLSGGEHRVMAMVLVGSGRQPGADLTDALGASSEEEAIGPLVKEHGGQIDRLADGTSVVTLAAAGVATDHAARAARFALALREKLPGVPMALATGRGDLVRRALVGDAIDRAARMLDRSAAAAASAVQAGQPPPSAIAVDDATAALLGARFDVVSGDGGLSLEGMRELEIGARTLLGRAMPMVGRDWEMSAIETLFFDCVEEPLARALLVSAPAGMGKSRLGHETVRALRRRVPHLKVWMGRGDPLRADSALGLLGDLVRSACGLTGGEAVDPTRHRLTDGLGPRMVEFLGEMVQAPVPREGASVTLAAARRDPRLMSEHLQATLEALIAAECAARPLLVVLEDLQWADAPTVRFIEAALGALSHRPWMVLALARPEVHDRFPRLWAERHVQEIRLKPLSRRAGERLLRRALGESTSAETVSRVLARAEGNAFYLEELIRAVADDARRAGEGGEPTSPRPLPETVLAMVQARLEALDPAARRVLRAASIFGEVFWSGGLAALLGEALPDGWEDGLLTRELVVRRPESRFAGEHELEFRHALLCEGSYATLTEPDRALGHQLAGEWLETHGERDALRLARHADLAGEAFRARAAGFYVAAAGQALRGADPDAAIARVSRVLGEPEGSAAPAAGAVPPHLRAEALMLRCEALAWRSDWAGAARDAAEIAHLVPAGSAPWIQAYTIRQTAAFLGGRPLDGVEALAALAQVEPVPGAAGAVTPALIVGVLILCLGGQFTLARIVLDRAGEMVDRAPDDPFARAWLGLGRTFWAAWHDGDFWIALREGREAQATFSEAGDPRRARFAQLFVAMCLWSLGLLDEAERELRALPSSGGEHLMAMIGSLYLTTVLIDRGALVEARALAERRLPTRRPADRPRTGDRLREAEARWLLGEIAVAAGDLPTAERELTRAVEGLRTFALSFQIAAARLVSVHIAAGRVTEALALAREAREAQRSQGGHGQRGTLVRLCYAEALAAAGEHQAARAELAEARADLHDRASRIDDETVRHAFLTVVAENARVLALSAAAETAGGGA